MSASRIRVRQPVSFAGLVLLLAWAGLAWGLVGGSSYRLSMAMSGHIYLSPLIMETIWSVLGLWLVLFWLPLLSQGYQRTFLAGGAAGGAYVFGHDLVWEILFLGLVEWTWTSRVEQFVGIAIWGIILGLLAMLAVLIGRTFFFTLVCQDGTLCNRCGYAVGKTDALICPECGSERDTKIVAPRGGRLVNWLDARARRATIALVALIAGLLLWLTWLLWPFMQFRHQFHDSPVWTRTDGFQLDFPTYTLSATQPVQDSLEDAWLIVDLGRRNPFSAAQMRVRIGTQTGQPPYLHVIDGTLRIICELRGEQMLSVVRDGVPQKLIDRLMETALEHEWSPDRHTPYWEMPDTVWVQPP